jgi:lipoate-protein ligase A
VTVDGQARILDQLRLAFERRDADRLAALLLAPPAGLGAKMIALGELLGRPAGFEEVARALGGGFEEAWGIAFEQGELTAEERALAGQLRAQKYADAAWTYAR